MQTCCKNLCLLHQTEMQEYSVDKKKKKNSGIKLLINIFLTNFLITLILESQIFCAYKTAVNLYICELWLRLERTV